jgi:hypothetical protein
LPEKKRLANAGHFFGYSLCVQVTFFQSPANKCPGVVKQFGSWPPASDMLAICGEHAIRSVDE